MNLGHTLGTTALLVGKGARYMWGIASWASACLFVHETQQKTLAARFAVAPQCTLSFKSLGQAMTSCGH